MSKKIRPKNWQKEIARDAIALGSIPFYFIVIVRAVIGQSSVFITQLVIALVAWLILARFVKDADAHISRSFILFVFISLFYQELIFTIFAAVLWVMIMLSGKYLGRSNKALALGALVGILSSVAGFYLAGILI